MYHMATIKNFYEFHMYNNNAKKTLTKSIRFPWKYFVYFFFIWGKDIALSHPHFYSNQLEEIQKIGGMHAIDRQLAGIPSIPRRKK